VGFATGAHVSLKITYGCIVLIKDSEEVDELKHEQEALRSQLREIKLANLNIKSAYVGLWVK
jgi:toxic protein SymE